MYMEIGDYVRSKDIDYASTTNPFTGEVVGKSGTYLIVDTGTRHVTCDESMVEVI